MAKSEAVKDPAVKGKLKLILLLVLALLLAIGLSVGATWFFLQRGDSKPQVDPATVSNVRPAAIYEPLAPAFVVNF
ncbi:MAG: flagellar basal body-associated protein FliL, partial [Pseudomonas qingdaonensis]